MQLANYQEWMNGQLDVEVPKLCQLLGQQGVPAEMQNVSVHTKSTRGYSGKLSLACGGLSSPGLHCDLLPVQLWFWWGLSLLSLLKATNVKKTETLRGKLVSQSSDVLLNSMGTAAPPATPLPRLPQRRRGGSSTGQHRE